MEFVLPVLLGFAFFYLRKVWSDRRKIPAIGIIDRISLCKIQPDIISPEVNVRYKYYYDSGVYFGNSYVVITDFFGDRDFQLYLNSENDPVLEFADQRLISEEYIEEYLLGRSSNVVINLDPVEPYRSEILELKNEKIGVVS